MSTTTSIWPCGAVLLALAVSCSTAAPVAPAGGAAGAPKVSSTEHDVTEKVIAAHPRESMSDQALFDEMMDEHYLKIFPPGISRNAGGPQFFKYIHDELAVSHSLFERYNRFYCGVSGSIIKPARAVKTTAVRVKDAEGACVHGAYHRCCWPCTCDVMKFARAERVTVRLPKDPSGEEREYTVLTIGDPCFRCEGMPCADIPPRVGAFECRDGRTANGLRVKEGRLTDDRDGRLVFALLYEAEDGPTDARDTEEEQTIERCAARTSANPEELAEMGGMGNIFVNLARVNESTAFSDSAADLCEP